MTEADLVEFYRFPLREGLCPGVTLQSKFRVLVSESSADTQCVLEKLGAPRRRQTSPPAAKVVVELLLIALLELLSRGQRHLEDFSSWEL